MTHAERREPKLPPGMIDYQAHAAIRDLIRVYGFEEARALVANILNMEADRKSQ